MATTNPVTGDPLITKPVSKAYRDNYDRIFRSKGLQHLPVSQAGSESGRYTPKVLGVYEPDASNEQGFTSMGQH